MSLTSSKIITIGVLLLAFLLSGCQSTQKYSVQPKIPIKAQAFDLSEVKLLDGPFRDAMEVNLDYLLSLEPDRFLAWYRKEAGLEPKGEVYGGWESDGYVLSGHSLGHYLSALSKQYQTTGDKRVKEKMDYIVRELALIQKENGNGYVGAIPNGKEIFEEISRGDIRPRGFSLNGANVPWYNLDKLFKGLKDAYVYADNKQALDVVTKLTDWAYKTTENLTPEDWQKMMSVEYGGMIHSLADIYAITGNPKHLELAKKFYDHEVLDPLAEQQDKLAGHHANTQIPKIRGIARLYELTGDPEYRTIVEYFWNEVVNAHTYVNGGNSSEEGFGAPNQLSDRLEQTTETCNTTNMLWLTRLLFSWDPQGKYMDYYERALYNHILASQNPETGMYIYKGYLEMPARKFFSSPTESFWCDVGTGMENHTHYGDAIYNHTGDSLYVNLFIASVLNWEDKGIQLQQDTKFPVEEGTQLTLSVDRPIDLSLMIRKPAWWGTKFAITVKCKAWQYSEPKDGYIEIRRTFEDGDTIAIDMPMEHRIESMPDNPDRIALFHGPVLLNAILAENSSRRRRGGDNEPNVPQLVGTNQEILDSLQPVEGKPLNFRAEGVGRIKNENGVWETTDLYFKPQNKTVDELYTVYLDRIDG